MADMWARVHAACRRRGKAGALTPVQASVFARLTHLLNTPLAPLWLASCPRPGHLRELALSTCPFVILFWLPWCTCVSASARQSRA